MRRMGVLVAASALLLGSCGGDEETDFATYEEACAATPGCGEAPVDLGGPRETLYRIVVKRSGTGEVSFGRIERFNVLSAVGITPGPSAGDLLLVARDASGSAIDGQLVDFPEYESLEQGDEQPFHTFEPLTGMAVSSVAYLRALPELADIALLDVSGAVVAETTPPAEGSADGVGGTGSALTGPDYCAHVQLIETEEERDAEGIEGTAGTAEFATPRESHRTAISAAFGRMSPLLCKAVSRIVLVRGIGPGGVVNTAVQGDVIAMNVDKYLMTNTTENLRFQEKLIHESTHAAMALPDAEASAGTADYGGDWDATWRMAARDTLDRVRLQRGFADEWDRMNESFVDQGWAASLPRSTLGSRIMGLYDDVDGLTDEDIARRGNMSHYGATLLEEDIAEMVALAIMGEAYRGEGITGAQDLACQAMQRYAGGGVPARYSAVYGKLHLAQDIGLLSDDQVDTCTGAVDLPILSEGFSFNREGSSESYYDDSVMARIASDESISFFELSARGDFMVDGMTMPANVRLVIPLASAGTPLEEISWPRGVYDLDGDADFLLSNDDLTDNFDFNEGWVFVAEASNDRIAGSIYTTSAERYVALTRTDVPFDPPYVIRFEIAN